MLQEEQKFAIKKIYTKDVSFEAPGSPEIFRASWNPKTDVQLSSQNTKMADNLYEVTLDISVTSRQEDKTVFLIELEQSGLFVIENYSGEQLNQLLASYCPHTLFPFARELVSDLITKGGFPPLILAPINFDALYAQKQQQTSTKH